MFVTIRVMRCGVALCAIIGYRKFFLGVTSLMVAVGSAVIMGVCAGSVFVGIFTVGVALVSGLIACGKCKCGKQQCDHYRFHNN